MIQLNGRLNKTGVISPRFNVQVTQIESWVNLLLPARGFGKIILVGCSESEIDRTWADFVRDDRLLRQEFLITRRLVARTLVGSFWDMSTSVVCYVALKTMPCMLCMFTQLR